MRFSVTGFIIGAVCAVIFFVVATAILSFAHEGLILGLIALAIWLLITTSWRGGIGVTR